MGRKRARENAMSLIYKMEMNGDFSNDMLNLYLESFSYDGMEKEYIEDAASKIGENLEIIDEYIQNNLDRWRIDRLAKVDLSVLRIAVYEMLYRDDIPLEVIINEAIEIVKKYSEEDSYKFVNGVLGGVVKDIEQDS